MDSIISGIRKSIQSMTSVADFSWLKTMTSGSECTRLTRFYQLNVGMYDMTESIYISSKNARTDIKQRNLDGIYVMINRDNESQPVCLSDMTREELEESLPEKSPEWLMGAVIHLAQTLYAVGDKFGIERV